MKSLNKNKIKIINLNFVIDSKDFKNFDEFGVIIENKLNSYLTHHPLNDGYYYFVHGILEMKKGAYVSLHNAFRIIKSDSINDCSNYYKNHLIFKMEEYNVEITSPFFVP